MKIKRFDATISTFKLQESKEFYMKYFGFKLVYESDWYIELMAPERKDVGVSFTLPQRDEGEYFNGRGMIFSFEVEDVEAEYARLSATDVIIAQDLKENPWGEKSFILDDPNGVHIYIYEAIAATPEYQKIYDKYKD